MCELIRQRIYFKEYCLSQFYVLCIANIRVSTLTGKNGKLGKIGRHFLVREKHTKYWKTQRILKKKVIWSFGDI